MNHEEPETEPETEPERSVTENHGMQVVDLKLT